MPSDWKEDKLKYKYDPIPEEVSYKKKKTKKAVKKSDHKHKYAYCIFSRKGPQDSQSFDYSYGTYCTICGRIGDRVFFGHDNPDNVVLPIFWNIDFFKNYVNLDYEEEENV